MPLSSPLDQDGPVEHVSLIMVIHVVLSVVEQNRWYVHDLADEALVVLHNDYIFPVFEPSHIVYSPYMWPIPVVAVHGKHPAIHSIHQRCIPHAWVKCFVDM